MKKTIAVLMFMMCMMNICAQSVSYTYKPLAKEGCTVEYSAINHEDKSYIVVSVKSENGIGFINDPIMMLKTGNNEIIKLSGLSIGNHKEGGYGLAFGNLIIAEDTHVSTVQFEITDEQIEMLKDGVIKVRLSTAPYIHEREFKSDKIGKKLYKAFSKQKNTEF